MRSRIFARRFFIGLLLLGLLPLMQGCSPYTRTKKTFHKLSRSVKSFKPFKAAPTRFKKKVAVAFPAAPHPKTNSHLESVFYQTFIQQLQQTCPQLNVVKPADPGFPSFLIDLPQHSSGITDTYFVSQKSKPLGFNAILSVSLVGIRDTSAKKGLTWLKDFIPWFGSKQALMEAQVIAEIYDIETGAKLMDELFVHTDEFEQSDSENPDTKQMEASAAHLSLVKEITVTVVGEACEILRRQPWVGNIVRMHAGKIVITGGVETGFKSGQRMLTYDISRVIRGPLGQRFHMRGEKTGELEISTLGDQTSEAVAISDHGISIGNSVVPK